MFVSKKLKVEKIMENVVSDKNRLFAAIETECHHLKVDAESDDILKVWVKQPTWLQVEQALSSIYAGIVQAKVDATTQIAIDNQQAIDLQELNQLIAQTNQITSLATYQNETRELKLTKEKTANYFLPIILILVLLTLTIYYFKK